MVGQVGSDRLDEIENPELATQRTRELYKFKGYPDDWIEKRMRCIAIREELTDSPRWLFTLPLINKDLSLTIQRGKWKARDLKEHKEYAMLTAEISRATFGITPSQYKKVKGLKSQNLRDHMDDLELIFSMLGEASTTAIVKTKNPKGLVENKIVAKQGGSVAGKARIDLEKKSGKKVVSAENFLRESKKNKQIKNKK
ncbi:MAG: hypothetical protein ABIW47_04165 [Ginsengibacter sp.]